MAGNESLRKANKIKQDEFYTQLADIEKEVKYYKDHFKDKVVFCNCDDRFQSNFFKYFAMTFNYLGLKKLICTCYADSPISGEQLSLFDLNYEVKAKSSKNAYKIIITEVDDSNNDGAIDLADVEYLLKNKKNTLTLLKEDGDFRSKECIELLKQSDIVVTNPPFSLFREYVSQLIQFKKSFLIIGSQNAITYQEIFSLLKSNKIWLGYKSGDMSFTVPSYYPEKATRFWIDESGQKWRSMGNICWFTNLDIAKRHESLILYKHYNPEEYPKYDNYDAINVNKVVDIPCDYDKYMGVPITFMDKYNPEQFKIVDALNRYSLFDVLKTNEMVRKKHSHTCNINGKSTYFRIIIQSIGVDKNGN